MDYRIGDIVEGVVSGIQPYGAFVTFEGGFSGLIHISEITTLYVKNVNDYFKVGDRIRVKIIDLDASQKHAKLSIKAIDQINPRKQRRKNWVNQKTFKEFADNQEAFLNILQRQNTVLKVQMKEMESNGMIKIDFSRSHLPNINEQYQAKVSQIHQQIHERTGLGNDYLGWLDYPETYDMVEFQRLLNVAQQIRQDYEVLVVCGIGGSYLGARAVQEMILGLFPSKKIEIIFLGNTFSSTYTKQVLDYIRPKRFAINVISKSGTTTETAIAFRLLRQLAIDKYGPDKARKAIFATTDKQKGILKKLAVKEQYETFVIPDDIGGRYSVFTSVGLLPLAVAGIDVRQLLLGAAQARNAFSNPDLKSNIAYQYAIARDYWYRQGKAVELFVTYEPHFASLSEWLKQLFGETEGKEGKALFPTSANFSMDLHSLGQFIQEGSKILFETIIDVVQPAETVVIPRDANDDDQLNYLQGKTLAEVNQKAMLGTMEAHSVTGQVPTIRIEVPQMNALSAGYLLYFFMKSCAMSAYLLGVNPFNQPGVEVYKANMFRLLGKK